MILGNSFRIERVVKLSPYARQIRPRTGDATLDQSVDVVYENEETFLMSSLYAMQRDNGDWFALNDQGRLRVPVFRSSGAAMRAYSRNQAMFLFKPVVFDNSALKTLAVAESGNELGFWLVDDPLINFSRGRLLDQSQIDTLMQSMAAQQKR